MFKSSGVTLFELLICISIIATISMFYFSQNKTCNLYPAFIAHEIEQAIKHARTQSIINKKTLILQSLYKNDWSTGMKLCDDAGACERQWHWSQAHAIHIVWHGFQSKHVLIFRPEVNQNAVNGYFLIDIMSTRLKLIVNRMGKTRTC